jgi:hypothetical protein
MALEQSGDALEGSKVKIRLRLPKEYIRDYNIICPYNSI